MASVLGTKTSASKTSNSWSWQGCPMTVKCCEGVPSAMTALHGKRGGTLLWPKVFSPHFIISYLQYTKFKTTIMSRHPFYCILHQSSRPVLGIYDFFLRIIKEKKSIGTLKQLVKQFWQ